MRPTTLPATMPPMAPPESPELWDTGDGDGEAAGVIVVTTGIVEEADVDVTAGVDVLRVVVADSAGAASPG